VVEEGKGQNNKVQQLLKSRRQAQLKSNEKTQKARRKNFINHTDTFRGESSGMW
jgi:hypothetical protein